MKLIFIIIIISMSFSIFGNNKYAFGLVSDYTPFESTRHSSLVKDGSLDRLLFTIINNNLKLEAQGMISWEKESDNNSDSSFLIGDISFGAYIQNYLSRKFQLYYGAKLGFIFTTRDSSNNYGNNNDKDLLSYSFTPAFGSEYFIIPNLSLSAEIGLKLVIMDYENDLSEYFVFTRASLLIKWYL